MGKRDEIKVQIVLNLIILFLSDIIQKKCHSNYLGRNWFPKPQNFIKKKALVSGSNGKYSS